MCSRASISERKCRHPGSYSGPGSVFLSLNLDFHAPVRPGDRITAEVEALQMRSDKPIAELRTTITRQDGVVAASGTAVTYQEPL